ncbi:MAG: GxxExxY protein [Candidatus Riesia sp.]|nr:GxxExxY protein [Candidatus Riesia sp.]
MESDTIYGIIQYAKKVYYIFSGFLPRDEYVSRLFYELERSFPVIRDPIIILEYAKNIVPNFALVDLLVNNEICVQVRAANNPIDRLADKWKPDVLLCGNKGKNIKDVIIITFGVSDPDDKFIQITSSSAKNDAIIDSIDLLNFHDIYNPVMDIKNIQRQMTIDKIINCSMIAAINMFNTTLIKTSTELSFDDRLGVVFKDMNIPFSSQKSVKRNKKMYRPDYILYDSIVVELKRVNKIGDKEYDQMVKYLNIDENLGWTDGIVINFSTDTEKFRMEFWRYKDGKPTEYIIEFKHHHNKLDAANILNIFKLYT